MNVIHQLSGKYSVLYEEYIEVDEDLKGQCDLIVSHIEEDDTNDTPGDYPIVVIEAKKKNHQHHRKFYLPDIRRVANILLKMLTVR